VNNHLSRTLLPILLATATVAGAQESAFQLSLTPDVALHPATTKINGLSLSIWGQNPGQRLSLGFVNGSTGDAGGLAWGLVNYDDNYTGVAWAWINVSRQNFTGWQSGMVNVAQGSFTGVQSGCINYAEEFHGLQLGLVNWADNLHGVQIGFANVAVNNPWFTAMPDKFATAFPFVNWSF